MHSYNLSFGDTIFKVKCVVTLFLQRFSVLGLNCGDHDVSVYIVYSSIVQNKQFQPY